MVVRVREPPAMKRNVSMVLVTSASAPGFCLPVLADSMSSNACRFSSTMLAIRFRTSARSLGVVAPQDFWATTAACTAASTSSAVPACTEAMTCSVVGSTTSISSPVEPGTNDPLMKCPAGGKGSCRLPAWSEGVRRTVNRTVSGWAVSVRVMTIRFQMRSVCECRGWKGGDFRLFPEHAGREVVEGSNHHQADDPGDVPTAHRGGQGAGVDCGCREGNLDQGACEVGADGDPIEPPVHAAVALEEVFNPVVAVPQKVVVHQVDGRPGDQDVHQEGEEVCVEEDEVVPGEQGNGDSDDEKDERRDAAGLGAWQPGRLERLANGQRAQDAAVEVHGVRGRDTQAEDTHDDQGPRLQQRTQAAYDFNVVGAHGHGEGAHQGAQDHGEQRSQDAARVGSPERRC